MQFRQSCNDFPLTVRLGEETPSWGLSRWGGYEGLRFVPPDDEGFTLRGDRRRLVYKGRRCSHRFTILGDSSFEYDCILLREPESNVVSLLMDGAEKFDFFRQPDFVCDPFLKGSYAVYKKETLLGEGSGKLCHIHRPQIIDARGRRCWGELSVVGNRLCITIPENWLGEAKYPVIVDPTVGTSTVGKFNEHVFDAGEDPETLFYEGCTVVNRFLVPETINGLCTAYFYTNEDEPEAGGRPVFYSDNNNVPNARRSADEAFVSFRVNSGNPKGWRSATFRSNSSISSGSYIWFGCFTDFWWFPRFDYGARSYYRYWGDWDYVIPELFKPYNFYEDFKFSMYFTYSSAQNYIRTLTQGVTLTDSRKMIGVYKRFRNETVGAIEALGRFVTTYRKCVDTVYATIGISRLPVFLRTVKEHIQVIAKKREILQFFRKCIESVRAELSINKMKGIYCHVIDIVSGSDNQEFYVLLLRTVKETAGVTHSAWHWGDYIRGLKMTAENTAETTHKGTYYRKQSETVQAQGKVLRALRLFIRIVTGLFVRDYLFGRFLKARQELVLKSCITREITFESRID